MSIDFSRIVIYVQAFFSVFETDEEKELDQVKSRYFYLFKYQMKVKKGKNIKKKKRKIHFVSKVFIFNIE